MNIFRSMLLLIIINFIFIYQARAGEIIEYQDGETVLEGYIAFPDDKGSSDRQPAVIVAHQWKGITSYEKSRVDMLAQQGYIAFALDMYGKGVRPETSEQAGEQATKYKTNETLALSRLSAALNVLKARSEVDQTKIAIIGYCFGGTMALELARSGADIVAAVSFHGSLKSFQTDASENIKASIFVHHGADDPLVPMLEVQAFREEMKKTGADWQFIEYSGAVHSFTEKEAGDDPKTGVAYNKNADIRSWAYTLDFLDKALN